MTGAWAFTALRGNSFGVSVAAVFYELDFMPDDTDGIVAIHDHYLTRQIWLRRYDDISPDGVTRGPLSIYVQAEDLDADGAHRLAADLLAAAGLGEKYSQAVRLLDHLDKKVGVGTESRVGYRAARTTIDMGPSQPREDTTMSLTVGGRVARFGPVRLGAYKRLSRNDVEDIGLAALAVLLVVVAFEVLKVAAWLVYELVLLSWRGLRWLWRREKAGRAAKAATAVVLAATTAAMVLGSGVAHADPDPATPDPSDVQCYPGAIYCPPPYYSQWSRDNGNQGDCQWFGGGWYSTTGPCNGSRQ